MLNIVEISIAHKYREGKLKSTLERELKGTEIAGMEMENCNLSCSYGERSLFIIGDDRCPGSAMKSGYVTVAENPEGHSFE